MRRFVLLAGLALLGTAWLAAARDEGPAAMNDAHDVLFLGEARPVFLRLRVRAGSEPAVAAYDRFLERLFKFLDRNDSGGLDRSESRQVPTVAQLNQYLTGNPYLVGAGRPGMMTPSVPHDDLDADRDGKVTLDELKAFYRKNGVGAVVLNDRAAFTAQDTLTDIVFNLLDEDRDGKLSKQELLNAEKVLARLDQDDDELISITELGGNPYGGFGRPVAPPRMVPGAPPAAPSMTLELLPRTEDGREMAVKLEAARKVIARYDSNKDGRLTAAESGLPKDQFARIDRNRDGRLDALEVARWLNGTPDAEYSIALAGDGPPAGRPGKAATKAPAASSGLTVGSVQLTVIGQPVTSNFRFNYKDQVLGQFRALDVEKKGYLTRKQLDAQTLAYMRPFIDVADRNGDNRLSRQELSDYLDLVAMASSAQVSLTLTSSGQGLFQALDTNGDGHLSIRELRNAWARLGPFDSDGDGAITRSEFPRQVRLTVGRGSVVRGDFVGGGTVPTTGRAIPTQGPVWFRKMDRNGDGDVSRAEWLGSAEDFDRADTNRDGLIGVEEAEAFDQARRAKKE